MAQFRVYRVGSDRLVLDLQTDLIDTGTRVVAPLIPRQTGPHPLPRLEPIFDIRGTEYVLHTGELAAIPAHILPSEPVADLRAHDYAIKGALDMVFLGF